MRDELLLREFKDALENRRKEILSQLEHFEEALSYLEKSRPPEFSEEAQEEAAAISLKALHEVERRELTNIAKALDKIRQGTFGVCERCSKEIGLTRLQALPMVRLCIKCQKRVEGRTRRTTR